MGNIPCIVYSPIFISTLHFKFNYIFMLSLFFRIALKVVSEKLTSIKTTDSKASLLGEYLSSDETDYKDVVGMTVDTLLAGIDTVILYNR